MVLFLINTFLQDSIASNKGPTIICVCKSTFYLFSESVKPLDWCSKDRYFLSIFLTIIHLQKLKGYHSSTPISIIWFALCIYAHMRLADGDSLMCYIVRVLSQVAYYVSLWGCRLFMVPKMIPLVLFYYPFFLSAEFWGFSWPHITKNAPLACANNIRLDLRCSVCFQRIARIRVDYLFRMAWDNGLVWRQT